MPTELQISEYTNRARNNAEVLAGNIRLNSMPQRVDIEGSLRCNLRCAWCHEHSPYFDGMPKRVMVWPEELTERIEKCIKTATVFSFQGFSEPLLDMHLVRKWLDVADRLTINRVCRKVGLVTNGIFPLSSEHVSILDHPSLGTINFSMDAATPETFAFIKKAPMSRAVTNLKALLKARREREREPWIGVSFIVTAYNIHELLDFVLFFCMEGVDYINIYDCIVMDSRQLAGGTHMPSEEFSFAKAYISPSDKRFSQLFTKTMDISKEFKTTINWGSTFLSKRICTAPWNQINIQTNGDIRVCCRGHTVIGNLFENSFDEIWNGKAVQCLRQQVLKGGIPDLCANSVCPYIQQNNNSN